jgi:putative ABC transport system permease protein
MWRNYWTVAVRALAKNRTYSIINIAGLAIGMAACVMILLYIHYEQSYDDWLPDAKNTYQFQTWYQHGPGGGPAFLQMAPYAAKAALKKDFPQIERVGYLTMAFPAPVIMQDGQPSTVEDYAVTDDDFLKVVKLPLIAGTTLPAVQTAVLSQSEARKRFGTDQVVGRTLSIVQNGKPIDYKITGVFKDISKHSSLKLNAILRVNFTSYMAEEFQSCWTCQSGWIYLNLRPETDVKQLQAAITPWKKRNIPDQDVSGFRYNPGSDEDFHFINIRDVHLGKAKEAAMTPGYDERTVATFAIIALLILAMAIINFTNLATARAGQRAREVALRKVLGASRKQLIVQFLAESILLSAVAMLLALALVELLVRPYAAFLDADLSLNYFGNGGIFILALELTLLVGVVSGLYPAFFLSRFRPAQVLKANHSAADTPGSGRLRQALVVLQFAVSIGLIVCTTVVYAQTIFARTTDPGYQRDHILQVDNVGQPELVGHAEAMVEQMKHIPGVVAVGLTDLGVSTNMIRMDGVQTPGSTKAIELQDYQADAGFFNAAGLRLRAGRWFDPNRPADDQTPPPGSDPLAAPPISSRGVNVMINEAAVRQLGYKSPQDAIGKVFQDNGAPLTVIGVVGDANFRSVREPIPPLMFKEARKGPNWMIIRYRGDPEAVRSAVEQKWKQLVNDVPFEAKFSEDIVREQYKAEQSRAETFAAFSVLAVLIGCLGLFGLAAFTAERRTKEIGIRKVLGARTRDIVRLLVWQFSRPVIVANLIAWPVAWWVMRDWLNGFDQRIALTPIPFVIAAVIALAIAIATVAGHAIKVARSNPINALRYE